MAVCESVGVDDERDERNGEQDVALTHGLHGQAVFVQTRNLFFADGMSQKVESAACAQALSLFL